MQVTTNALDLVKRIQSNRAQREGGAVPPGFWHLWQTASSRVLLSQQIKQHQLPSGFPHLPQTASSCVFIFRQIRQHQLPLGASQGLHFTEPAKFSMPQTLHDHPCRPAQACQISTLGCCFSSPPVDAWCTSLDSSPTVLLSAAELEPVPVVSAAKVGPVLGAAKVEPVLGAAKLKLNPPPVVFP